MRVLALNLKQMNINKIKVKLKVKCILIPR